MTESEVDAYEQAVAAAQEAVAAGDRPAVAAGWAVEQHGIEHRFEDVLAAVQEDEADD